MEMAKYLSTAPHSGFVAYSKQGKSKVYSQIEQISQKCQRPIGLRLAEVSH